MIQTINPVNIKKAQEDQKIQIKHADLNMKIHSKKQVFLFYLLILIIFFIKIQFNYKFYNRLNL